jgi:hypothetical protein
VLLPSVACEHKIDYRDQSGHTQYRNIHFEEKETGVDTIPGVKHTKSRRGGDKGIRRDDSIGRGRVSSPLAGGEAALQPVIVPRTEVRVVAMHARACLL